jgi:hypothetical protein
MICKICGRTITNDTANFCEYCGASFRPGTDNRDSEKFVRNDNNSTQETAFKENDYANARSQQNPYAQGMAGQRVNTPRTLISGLFDSSDRPMTMGNWLIIYLLPFVPIVGMVLFLVILFTWGFGAKVAPTKKNWARATLVMVVILILMLSVIISSGYLGDPNALLESIYGTSSL